MKTAINHNITKSLLVFLLLACSSFYMNAQVMNSFTPRLNETMQGDFTTIANNVLSRTATTAYTGQAGNHDFTDNVYVDIDNDATTFNSSSANLTNPDTSLSCLSIYKAYLYWAAADKEKDDGTDNQPNWEYNQVKLKLPGEINYSTVTADEVLFRGRDTHFVNDPYICFKDITDEVLALNQPYGTYQVANIEAKLGRLTSHPSGNTGTSGGWQIVFVYQSPEMPNKNVSIFDGYAHVTKSVNNFDIDFGGFQTPLFGDVKANILMGSLEGDRDLSGDMLQIKNVADNFVSLAAPHRDSNNFFNSKITVFDNEFLDRNPASSNTLGFDAGVFELNNPLNTIIGNSQADATIRLTSNQETYGLYLIGLAIDVWAPNLDPIVITLNSGNIPVDPSGTLGFNFLIENNGNDNARDLKISTTLPAQVSDVNANNLPAGVSYSFDSVTGELIFEVEDGYVDVLDPSINIDFEIVINDDCYFLETNCDLSFDLQFTATYKGVLNSNEQITLSSSGLDDCNLGNHFPIVIDINQPTLDWATAANALDRVIECGDQNALNDAQALYPELDKCDFVAEKTSGDFVEDGACKNTGTYTNTWTYTDACGVTVDTYVQTITIQDTTGPRVDTQAEDLTVECDGSGNTTELQNWLNSNGGAAATDDCSSDLTWTNDFSGLSDDCGATGSATVSFTVTDECNNSTSVSATFTIEDTTDPTFTAPADLTIECDQNNKDLSITGDVTDEHDNCSSNLDATYTDQVLNGNCPNEFTITRTWYLEDACGNSVTHDQVITVVDTTAPTFNEALPADVTVNADAIPAAAILTASDNCGTADVVFNETENGSYCDASHTIQRTWVATDLCGLTASHTQIITVLHPVLDVNIDNVVDVLCTSEATGSISISVSGGIPPYSYSWNNGDTSEDISNVIAGAYSVTVTDSNGCTAAANATINEPANPLSLNISKIDATTAQACSNGEANVSVTGGTPPYTYQWSASAGNQTTANATNLSSGTHTITVTDAHDCELVQSIVIECVNTCDAEISIDDVTNVLCTGDNTGSGTVSASSNSNPSATFTFTWSNGQIDSGVTSSTLSNQVAGVYTVSVTIDGTVCQPVEDTISITEPSNVLIVSVSSTDELGPSTGDGTATAVATGGVEPYTYLWSPGGETTAGITGLSTGSYTVTVTDANGCTAVATVTVNPGTCNNLSLSGASTPVICFGESNGSVTATVSGGTGPFSYSWDSIPDTTATVNNLPAGDYTITVLDETTQCTQSITITINEPNELSSGIAVTNIQCKNENTGSLDLTVNGGTPPYSYLWSEGSTSEDLIGVPDGTYSVTITDANGCTTTNSGTVIEPDEVVSISFVSKSDIVCEGFGTIVVEGSGGVPPYQYSIDGGTTYQASNIFSGLDAGNYTVMVMDANGCTDSIDGYILFNCTYAIDDINNTLVNVPVSGNVLTNDFDLEGDTQTVTTTQVTTAQGVIVNIDPNTGVYTYNPPADYIGEDSFVYTICDDGIPQACDSAVVYIEVISTGGPENEPPIANPDTALTEVDTPVDGNVLSNDFDPDNDPITVTTTTVVTTEGVTVTIDPITGEFTYTPLPGFTGTDSFEYTICDDGGLCDTAIVVITVIKDDGNITVANDDAYFTNPDVAIVANVLDNDFDPEGDNQFVNTTPFDDVDNGTLVLNADGTFTYTPNPGFTGTDSFIYTVCDDGTPVACDKATVYLTVGGIGNTTDAIDDINNTYVNVTVDGNVLTNDQDFEGDTQTVVTTTVTTAQGVTVTIDGNTGAYSYTPPADYIGEDSFDYTICDDGNPQACDTATVYIEVISTGGPENEAPIANTDTAGTEVDTPVSGNVLANDFDPDGDPITVTTPTVVTTEGVTVTIDPITGDFTYTPPLGFTGEDTFEYTICDDGNPALCDTAIVIITVVKDVQNITIANDDAYNTTPDTLVSGNVLDNDSDPEGHNQFVNTTPFVDVNNGTLVLNADGTFDYTPDAGFEGTDSFVYTVCDDGTPVACDKATVYITVGGIKNTTDAIIDINNTFVNLPVSGNVLTNDQDFEGDTQTVTTTTVTTAQGVVVTIDANTGEYLYTPPTDYIGEDSFEYTICDDGHPQACDSAMVYIEIIDFGNDDNEAPIANADTAATEVDTPVSGNVLVNDFDPDGDVIIVTTTTVVTTEGVTIVIDPNTGEYTYTPPIGFTGEDTFEYTICDPFGLCDTAIVVITVVANNQNITIANDDAYFAKTCATITGNVLDNDSDPEGHNQFVNPIPFVDVNNGTLVLNADGSFIYTPSDGFIGTDSFVYTVFDDGSPVAFDKATVYLTIIDATDPDVSACAVLDETIECDGDNNESIADQWNADNIAALEACATDDCDSDFTGQVTSDYAFVNLVSTCGQGGTITVTYTITDDSGNETTVVATLTLEDTTLPDLTNCSVVDTTIECDGLNNESLASQWNTDNIAALEACAADACDIDFTGQVTSDFDFANLVSTCGLGGTLEVTYTVTDDCGNEIQLVATLTIEDSTVPSFSVPADITIECDEDPNDLTLTGDVTTETDNCSGTLEASFTDSIAPGNCANEFIITRTWTLTDDCDNTTTADQTITVVDTTAPTFTVPADVTIECDQDPTDLILTGDVSDEADNCSTDLEATYTDSVADGACANESVITRTWTLTDDCGNTTTADQTITVVDTTAPTFTVPADVTIECDQDPTDLILTGDVSDEADNCSTDLEATYTDSVADGACANESVITRTWTLTDDCGNTTTADQTITVVDTTAPTFTVPADVTIECDQDPTDLILTGDVSDEADNCSTDLEATYTDSVADGACANESVITRTWTLTDDCGNTTTADQTITVVDTTAPTFTVPADVTIECDQDPTDLILTGDVSDEADNCSTDLEATYTDSVADGACANESVITRTWTLTDDCGNTTTADQTITVVDTTAPTFTVPADVTIECDQDPTDLILTGDVSDEADNCSTDLEATYTDSVADGACANESVITRTWTLTDDCGNTTTADQTLTVVDTTAPVMDIEADDIVVECDGAGNNDAIQDWLDSNGGASATDNCGDVTWSNDYDGATSDCSAPVIVTFTATDACGNQTTTSASYAIQDTTAPTIDAPAADATVECDGAGNATDLSDWLANNGGAVATDDCSSITWSNDFSALSDDCGATGSATVTFTATDGCGNESSTTATFTIVDTTAPTFTVPESITIECDQDPTDLTLTGDVSDEADNCSTDLEATYTDSVADGACANESVITRTWTLTDDCGNTTTADQTITVVDTTAPTFTVPADVTIECDQDPTDLILTGDVSDEADNCSTDLEATYTDSVADGACANESVITRTWTLTDDCGNTTTADQTITVVDTTAPTFTVPADVTIECDQDPTDLILTGDVSDEADNCSTDLEATYTDSVADGACANESVITRTWTLTDDCGNTTTADQTITVVDTTAPTFTVPADVTIECDQDPTDLILTGDVSDEADNCSTDLEATYTDSVADGACANESVITRTWTLTDDCGNTTTADQTITVVDTTAPTFTVPADVTIECDQDPTDLILTGDVSDEADNCSTDLEATYTDSVADGACANESVITRTWTLTDDCGNTTTADQTITVVDTTAPTFTVPADVTIECDQDPTDLILTGDVSDEADNCSTDLEATYTDSVADGACANESVITRTWTLTDDCGNTTTADQTLTVVDTTAPVMDIEADDIVVECDGAGNNDAIQDWLDSNGGASATDNCGDVTWSNDYDGATSDCSAPVIVTFTATDACGNQTTTSASYAIQDTTAPTIDAPAADATVECDGAGNATDLSDWLANNGGAVATDDCSSITWSNDFSALSDDCGATGSATVTFTATDGCGNESSTTATFTIVDTTAPTFTVPESITIECDQDPTDLILTGDVSDEADNCSTDLEATYTDSVADGACANESVITRTWTLTDDCGNTTTADQTITVVDTTAPTFTVPADVTIECDQTETDLALTGDVTDEADNCSTDLEATYEDSIVNGECTNEYIITRTWTLTDDCGNTTTAAQTISVVDTTAPTFTVPADVTIECDQDPTDLALTGDVTTEADNCSIDLNATYTDNVAAGDCANESIITRTWTLTDDCGNTTTADQTITVVDTTAPTFTVPESITIECDQDLSDLSIAGDVTDEADNCSTDLEATYVDSISEGECANEFTITRTWTLVDDCGNTTTADQTLSVIDTTAPVFSELPADATVECDSVPEAPVLTAEDNCGETTVTFEEEEAVGSCDGEYIITRTWIATDECQNESIHIQIITVQDTTAPVIVGDFEEEINVVCDEIPDRPNLVFEDACSTNISVVLSDSTTFVEGSTDDYEIVWVWTVSDDCGNEADYMQVVNVSVESDVTADTGNFLCTTEVFIVDLFDYLNGGFTLDGTWTVVSGDITLNGSEFDFDPADVEVGTYVFNYSDSSTACPYSVDLTLEIVDDCIVEACSDRENVLISKAVTANGDQWNEYFEITGIELCDFTVEVQIFNRWGAKIFESKNYQNDWNGIAHGNSVGSSGQVPTGTYYYIVNLKNSGLKPFAGPIYVGTK